MAGVDVPNRPAVLPAEEGHAWHPGGMQTPEKFKRLPRKFNDSGSRTWHRLEAQFGCTSDPTPRLKALFPTKSMKKPLILTLLTATTVAPLSASVTISALIHVPNGQAAGGTGSGTGALSTTPSFTISSDRGLPSTTYNVSNVDLTSVGGTSSESFSYTVGYSQSGGTGIAYSGFGNVGISGNSDININGSEVMTVTVTLTSTTFDDLSLAGFTQVRAGGFSSGETGTIVHGGGSVNVAFGDTIKSISGNSFTFSVAPGSALSLEGYTVQFVAVPEPASASLMALGAISVMCRRRRA